MINGAHKTDTIVIFIIALTVYVITCCRTVFVGDAGELTTILTTGGIAHPPGYPLYTILGYLWVKLFFFLRPAYAANLFSAFAAACSAAIMYRLLASLSSRKLSTSMNMSLALVFAFSYPVWMHAVFAEVYTFGAMLYLSALYAIVLYYQHASMKRLYSIAILCGLLLTHHFSGGVVILSAVLAIIIKSKTETIILRKAGVAIALFVMPLFLYGFLLFRFDNSLPINWMADNSLKSLWQSINATIYQQFVYTPTFFDLLLFLKRTIIELFWYSGPGILIIGFLGLIIGFRRNIRLFVLFSIPAFVSGIIVCCYRIPDYEGYIIPLVIALIIGLHQLLKRVQRTILKKYPVIINVVIVILVAVPILTNYSRCDLSSEITGEVYARDILDAVPQNAVLLLRSDNAAHSALYMRYCENYRSDIRLYTTNGTLTRLLNNTGAKSFSEAISKLKQNNVVCWGREFLIHPESEQPAASYVSRGLIDVPGHIVSNPEYNNDFLSETEYDLARYNFDTDDYKLQQVYIEYALNRIDNFITTRDMRLNDALRSFRQLETSIDDVMTKLAIAQFFINRDITNESYYWIEMSEKDDQPSYISREIYVTLGMLNRQLGKLNEASQALERAIKISPDYEVARYNLFLVTSEIAIRRRDYIQAIESFDSLITIEPNNPLLHYNKAVIYEKMPGYGENAISSYQSVLDYPGEKPPAIINKVKNRINALTSGVLSRE
ncbi:MAG: DUF2723 domain-containing protein [candidate division Zixibacteria bacterium]|nr:DUF2723 domain-containing protein [candidate division Zixibacteria bacterium]